MEIFESTLHTSILQEESDSDRTPLLVEGIALAGPGLGICLSCVAKSSDFSSVLLNKFIRGSCELVRLAMIAQANLTHSYEEYYLF